MYEIIVSSVNIPPAPELFAPVLSPDWCVYVLVVQDAQALKIGM